MRVARRASWSADDAVSGLLFAALFVGGVTFGVVVADQIATTQRLRERGAHATATVVDTRTERHRDPPGGSGPPMYTTYHYARVAFDAGPAGPRTAELPGEYERGETVPVVYDPNDPGTVTHAKSTSTTALRVLYVLLGAVAVALLAGAVRAVWWIVFG
jgi:hypothetical protein